MALKEAVRSGGQAVGLGRLLERAQSNWPSRTIRRDRRDNDNAIVAICARLDVDDDAVDVGAHQGLFLSAILRFAPGGSHTAFEPIPAMAAALEQRFPDVAIHNLALSDEKGEASFNYVPTMPGFSGFRDVAPAGAEGKSLVVATDRLDDVLDPGRKPAVVKIDVEGAELQVLRGARETLARHRPMVLLEHGAAAAHYGTGHGEVFDEIANAGLRIFDLDGAGPMSRDEFADRASRDRWNWLAR